MATLIVGESPCRIPQILDIIRNSGNLSLFRSNWEEFAKRLGVPEKSILELNNDLKWEVINLEGLLYDVLYTWRGNCGDDATLGVLCQALTDCHAKEIADKLDAEFAEILKARVLATAEVCLQGKRIKISDIFTTELLPRTSRRNLDPIQILRKLELEIPDPCVSTVPLAEFIQHLVGQLDEQEVKVLEGFSFKWLFPPNLAEIMNAKCEYDEDEARKLVQLEKNRVLWFVAARGLLSARLNEQQMQLIHAYVFECERVKKEEDEEEDVDEDAEEEGDEDAEEEGDEDAEEEEEETDVTIVSGKQKSYKFKQEQLVEFIDWLMGNGYELPLNFQLDWLDQYFVACLNYKNLAKQLFNMPNSRVYSLPGVLHRLVQHTMGLQASELEERVNLVLNVIRENPGSIKSLKDNLPPLLMDKVHVELIDLLIYAGANWNAVDESGANLVHVAAKFLPPKQFQQLVRYLVDHNLTHLLNATDSKKRTPLFYLIRYNAKSDPSTLQVVAAAGADFNATDKDGNTVLFTAVWYKRRVEILEALVKCGADFNWRSSINSNLLHHAACEGNLEAVKYFVRLGLGVNSRDNDLDTPLMKAVMDDDGCNLEVIKFLLESNADANPTEKTGSTVLSLAVVNNRSVEILQALVAYGADWNWKHDNDGSNLLHGAAYEGNLETVKYFVRLGLDVNSRDNDLDTPLMKAVMNADATKGWVKVVKFLLESNADVNASNKDGDTALLFAVVYNRGIETLQALVAYGADWNWKDVDNSNLLHEAAYEGNLEALKYFVRLGLDINSRDNELHTPLMNAVRNTEKACNVEMVKFLLENNADVNATDKIGNTALHYAKNLKQSEVDELLISKGATRLCKP